MGRNRYSTGSARTSIGCQGQGFCPSSSPELASGFIWAGFALKRKRVDVGFFFEKTYYQYRPGVCASHPAWPSTTRHCHLLSWISLSYMRHSQFLASIVSSIVKNMQLMFNRSYKIVLNCCCCSLYLIVLWILGYPTKSSTHINIINSVFLKCAICPGIGQVHTLRYTLRLATGPSTSTVCADIIRPVTGAWGRGIPSAEPNQIDRGVTIGDCPCRSCFSGQQICITCHSHPRAIAFGSDVASWLCGVCSNTFALSAR